jgi:hypothetical protein
MSRGAAGTLDSQWVGDGTWAAFISHYKAEAATEARYLKDKLTATLAAPVSPRADPVHPRGVCDLGVRATNRVNDSRRCMVD